MQRVDCAHKDAPKVEAESKSRGRLTSSMERQRKIVQGRLPRSKFVARDAGDEPFFSDLMQDLGFFGEDLSAQDGAL